MTDSGLSGGTCCGSDGEACAEEAAGASCGVQSGIASPENDRSWDAQSAPRRGGRRLFASMAPPLDRAGVDSDPHASSGLPARTGTGILADPSCATLSVENDQFRHGLLGSH